MEAPATSLPFGLLGRPHGLRGEIVLRPFNQDGASLDGVDLPWEVEVVRGEARTPMTLASARPFEGGWLVGFDGVEDRDAAAKLTNAELHVPRAALPPLAEGELYIGDLVGCAVYDQQGRLRGTVRGTFWNGAHDVLSVIDAGGKEILIPAVDEFLRELDLPARRLVIDDHE